MASKEGTSNVKLTGSPDRALPQEKVHPPTASSSSSEELWKLMRFLAPLSTLGVVVATARMPYAYYMLLRGVLCATTALVAAAARPRSAWFLTGVALAVLYNPFVPVHLND